MLETIGKRNHYHPTPCGFEIQDEYTNMKFVEH